MKTLFTLPTSVRAMARASVSVCAALVLSAFLRPVTASAQSPTVTGYNGTQAFVTSAGKDPDEPNACGVIGGASYWFTYKPPTNGVISIDTAGSSFDTVLGIYVDNGQNLGYSSLLPVTCNDNCGTGTLTSCVTFTGSMSTNYYIMLDGVNGATGTAYLKYHLATKPTITAIAKQAIYEDASTSLLSFTIGDPGYNATNLIVSGISSNLTLVATTNIVFGGTGSSRTVKVTPNKDMFGTNNITVVVMNPSGATNSTQFMLTVAAVNDPPKAVTDYVTRLPGKSITIARAFLLRNDTDVDSTNLIVSAVASKSKNGVAITYNATNIIYAAGASTNTDFFTYTVSDSKLTAIGTNFVNVATNGVTIVY